MAIRNPRKRAVYIAGALLAAALLTVFAGRERLAENPFDRGRVFADPSHAVTAGNLLLVTDGGKTRVTVLSGHKVSAAITGAKETGGFFYAEHTAAHGGKIYIADVKYEEGSTRVETERILRFSAGGRFETVLFERPYEEEKPFQHGNILDLRSHDGRLTFLMARDGALELYSLVNSLAGETPALLRSVSAENAPYLYGAVYDAFGDTLYAVSKDGVIYAEDAAGGLAALDGLGRAGWIPREAAPDGSGSLYITDLASQSIVRADGSVFFEGDGIIFRLDTDETGLVSFTDGQSVYQVSAGGETRFAGDSAEYTAEYFLRRLLVWLLAAASAAAVLFLLGRLGLRVLKGGVGQSKYLFIIIISVTLTSVIVAASIFSASIQTEAQEKEFSITQMTLAVSGISGMTIGDDFASLNAPEDYGGPAYHRVRAALDPICETAYEQGGYLYYVLHKVVDGVVYSVLDYEDTVGVMYPIAEISEGWSDVFEGRAPYLFESFSDVNGSWTYAAAPVFSSEGAIAGLVEMGYNLDTAALRTQRQIRDIALSTAVLLVMFILVFSEVSAILEPLSALRRLSGKGRYVPELIRPLIFLAFLADSACTAFIPQLSGRIFSDSGLGWSLSMGAALPLSAKLFFVAIAAVAGGVLIDRLGMNLSLVCGTVTEIAGLFLTAAAVTMNHYALLIAGLSLSGAGLGVVVVAGNTLPAAYEEERRKSALFSGVNIGMVAGIVAGTSAGAYAAQAGGYALTFLLSAAALLPALWLAFKSAPRSFGLSLSAQMEALEEKEMGLARFLRDKSVFSFLLFMMSPFMVILYFREFAFPLYASEQGVSEVGIGQALLFSGAAGIFIAPALSAALLKRLGGKRTNLLAGGLCAAGLILFALRPSFQSAAAAVFMMSAAACFGYVAQGVYFSSIRAVKAFGTGKSMGIYSLLDNLSQTAGPLLFGAALALGYRLAAWVIGLVSAALFLLFALLGRGARGGNA
ncbi:MAG: MFS transporter [Oscillospiraceae bacterium]|nr:MFS transporter [Oscillospiraceae bacterium]